MRLPDATKIGLLTFALLSFSQTAASFAQNLRLFDLLQASEKENPDIKVLEAKFSALEAKKSGATNIPAPMIGVSYMGTSGPFKSNEMNEKPSFEISQTIPFPTKIFAERNAANSELSAGRASKEYEKKLIVASVKAAFWNYYQAYHEEKYTVEQVKNLKNHLKRLSRSFVTDTLTNSHILSIQNEISLMESSIDEASLTLTKARNALFIFTGISKEELNRAPEEIPLSQSPLQPKTGESLIIKKAKAEAEQSRSELSLARNSYLPDLTLKYKWNSEFANTPRNQEIMLGIDLPFLFFWQPRATVSEARAKLIESEAIELKTQRESVAALSTLSEELGVKRRKIERLESDILPRSERRLKLAHSISFSDMQSLDQHREVLEDYLKLKLEKLKLRVEFEKQVAELEALQGDQ